MVATANRSIVGELAERAIELDRWVQIGPASQRRQREREARRTLRTLLADADDGDALPPDVPTISAAALGLTLAELTEALSLSAIRQYPSHVRKMIRHDGRRFAVLERSSEPGRFERFDLWELVPLDEFPGPSETFKIRSARLKTDLRFDDFHGLRVAANDGREYAVSSARRLAVIVPLADRASRRVAE